jgi:polysaccharide export outer membrane protein
MSNLRSVARATWLGLLLGAAGCATGEYIWVDAIPDKLLPQEREYIIAPADVLNVRVFGQDSVSGKVKVRSDGRISLPLLNDQVAAGLTPEMLAQLLVADLKTFVVNPVVTVSVEETHPLQVSVLGEVMKPGVFKLEPGSDILNTLALAGGLTPYARRDRIFVLRRLQGGGSGAHARPLRIRFRYDALIRAEGRSAVFLLQDGDVLVAE